MNHSALKSRKGIAIAVVLVFCMGILGLVSVLVMNTRFHKGSHENQFEQTRALMAAKSALQLAIYKFRVLPSEFYKIHEMQKNLRTNPADAVLAAKVGAYRSIWMRDFDSSAAGSPAAKIKAYLDSVDKVTESANHSFSVTEFTLVSSKSQGYIKDFLKIRAKGKFGNSEKVLEELIEVQIAE